MKNLYIIPLVLLSSFVFSPPQQVHAFSNDSSSTCGNGGENPLRPDFFDTDAISFSESTKDTDPYVNNYYQHIQQEKGTDDPSWNFDPTNPEHSLVVFRYYPNDGNSFTDTYQEYRDYVNSYPSEDRNDVEYQPWFSGGTLYSGSRLVVYWETSPDYNISVIPDPYFQTGEFLDTQYMLGVPKPYTYSYAAPAFGYSDRWEWSVGPSQELAQVLPNQTFPDDLEKEWTMFNDIDDADNSSNSMIVDNHYWQLSGSDVICISDGVNLTDENGDLIQDGRIAKLSAAATDDQGIVCDILDVGCWLNSLTRKLTNGAKEIFNAVGSVIAKLFIPSDDFMKEKVGGMYDTFKDQLGFLYFPVDFSIDLFQALATPTYAVPPVLANDFFGAPITIDYHAMKNNLNPAWVILQNLARALFLYLLIRASFVLLTRTLGHQVEEDYK